MCINKDDDGYHEYKIDTLTKALNECKDKFTAYLEYHQAKPDSADKDVKVKGNQEMITMIQKALDS